MLNEKIEGQIKSVSAITKNRKDENGEKVKVSFYRIKLVTDSIDYEVLAKWNASIAATLLNIQPMPFESVNFGDQSKLNMNLNMYYVEEVEDTDSVEFSNILIKNLAVKNNANIPTYIFTIEIPIVSVAKFLFQYLKVPINFEFTKTTTEEGF